jgi:hypothetical protein
VNSDKSAVNTGALICFLNQALFGRKKHQNFEYFLKNFVGINHPTTGAETICVNSAQ